MGAGSHRSGHDYHVWVVRIGRNVNTIPNWKKGVETLNEDGVSVEQHGNAIDYARSVDSVRVESINVKNT